MADLSDVSACGNVWARFYPAYRAFGDVAVASARRDDRLEWQVARAQALHNARKCTQEAARWILIADELSEDVDRTPIGQ